MAAVLAGVLLLAGAGSCVPRGGIEVLATRRVVEAADGFGLLTFQLTERGREGVAQARALVFYLQGSSCASALYAAELLAGATAMGIPVVVTERRGVGQDGAVDESVCHEFAGKGTRVADHLQVIRSYLGEASVGVPVVLVGGSEGGDVAAAVARQEPRVSHLVLLGTGGGWSQEEEIRHMVARDASYLGLDGISGFERLLAEIRRSPEALTLWAGHPYRRWSSYRWDPPVEDLLKLEIPIFLAHGSRDESVPVESARATRDIFARRGLDNLTYREYPEADHAFHHVETGAALLPLIEVDLVRWFTWHGITTETEARELERRVRRNHPDLFPRSEEAS